MPRSGSSTARYGGKRVKEEQTDDGPIPPSTTGSARRTGSSKQHKDEEQIEAENDNDNEEDEDENGVTRCVCGSNGEEDGFMIQCETCKAWQHGLCLGYHSEKDCPETYYCERCRPDLHVDLLKRLKKTRNVSVASTKSDVPKRIAVADRTILVPRTSTSRSPSPVPKPKSPKRRSTMNSRDAAYDIALAIAESRSRDAERSERGRSEREGSEAGNEDGSKRKRKRSASRSASRDMSAQPSKRARSASSASLVAQDREDTTTETMQVDDEDEDGSTAKRKSSSSTASTRGKPTGKGPKAKRPKAATRRKSGAAKRKSDSPAEAEADEEDAPPEGEGEAEQESTTNHQDPEQENANEDDVEAPDEGEEEVDQDDDTVQVKRLSKKASRPKLSHSASSSSRKLGIDETPSAKRPRPPPSNAESENSSTPPSQPGAKTKGGKPKPGGAKGSRTPAKGTANTKGGVSNDKSTPVPNGASTGGAGGASVSKSDKPPPKATGKGRANNPRGINGSAKQREAERERERLEREKDRFERGENPVSSANATSAGREHSRTGSPSPNVSPQQYWGLPDHLSHLAHILPAQPSSLHSSSYPTSSTSSSTRKIQKLSEEELLANPLYHLASSSYAYSYSSPIKAKWPGKRITIGDMNKRVRSIMEFIGREQGAAVLRQRRVEALEQTRENWLAENGGKLPAIAFEGSNGSGGRGGGGSSRGSSTGVRGKGGRGAKAAPPQLDEPKPAQLPELPAPPLPMDDEPPNDHMVPPLGTSQFDDVTLMDVDTPIDGVADDGSGGAPVPVGELDGQGSDGGDVTLKKEVTAQVPMVVDSPTATSPGAGQVSVHSASSEAGHVHLADYEAGGDVSGMTTTARPGMTDGTTLASRAAVSITAISNAASTMQAMAELMQDLLIFQEKFRPRERRRGDLLG